MLLVLLFFCAELVAGWPVFIKKYLVAAGVPIISNPFTPNLQTDARIELTHNLPTQICFQALYPISNNTDIWNITCSVYLSFDTTSRITHTGSVILRSLQYRVALYSLDVFQPQTDIILKIGSPNDSCEPGQVFDDSQNICKFPDGTLTPDTPVMNVHFTPGRTYFYTFFVDTLVGFASVKGITQVPGNLEDPGNLIFQIRYAASPSYGFYDGTSGSTATVNYPKPGQYFVAVTSSDLAPSTGSFILNVESCVRTNQTAGPGCKQHYNFATETAYNGVALAGLYNYWLVVATDRRPLWVSVRSTNVLDNPRLFATQGQLPRVGDKIGDPDNVDIRMCNEPFCQTTNIIRLPPAAASEKWYIGVLPPVGRNGTTYTIWFSSVCPPNCALHGTCVTSGPETGLCQCEANYGGVDCSVSYRVSAENIVLYIIAGLVFLSGVCAFIAAMVTKRPKRPRS